MKCKKMQDLLLTDYNDGRLNNELKIKVEDHLQACGLCKAFSEEVLNLAVKPFRGVQNIKPPESVWININNNISSPKTAVRGNLIDSFVQNITNFLKQPKFSFALAGILAVTIIGIISTTRQTNSNAALVSEYLNEQADFFANLEAVEDNGLNNDYADFGTAIEEYFL
ncbi:MAG: hypothetical protein ABH872_04430 [Candidatus Omnitrophota bacterium]